MIETDDQEQHLELRRAALANVCRLVSGEATIADVEEVRQWRNISPAHQEAFAFACRLWARLEPAASNVLAREQKSAAPARHSTRTQITRRAMLGAGAAAATVYLAARPPLGLWPAMVELSADYRTAKGEQRRLVLAGGAHVQLNTGTSISLRRPAAEYDRIELVSGEASIDTERQTSRPLEVLAGDGAVRATRANFNFRYEHHTGTVTCLDGAVELDFRNRRMTLHARQQAVYGTQGLSDVSAIDASAVVAWHDGLLVFRATPLAEVVREINRYRPGRIVLLNAELGRRTVDARFRIGSTDEILTLAQHAFGAKITALGNIVLIS